MRSGVLIRLLGGFLLGGLLASCQAPGRSRPASAAPTSAGSSTRAQGPESDAELERRVRAHAAFAAGIVRQMHDDQAGMLEYWTRAYAEDPGNEALGLEVARRRLTRQESDPALVILRGLAARPGASFEAHALLGLALLQSGKGDEAIAQYQLALAKRPGDAQIVVTLVRLLVDGKRMDEALRVIQQAATRPEASPALLADLADLLGLVATREPRLAEAAQKELVAVLDRAGVPAEAEPIVWMRLAERNAAAGRKDRAEQLYRLVRDKGPRTPFAAARLAELYLKEGRVKEAAEQLESLRREDPTNPVPVYYLGLIAFEQQDVPRARDLFERAILLNPDYEPAYLDLVSAHLALNKPAQALEAAQRARARFPAGYRLEFLTAITQGRLKAYDESFKAFQAAEQHGKTNQPPVLDHRFYFQVGAMLEQARRRDDAVGYLQKALELKPDFDEALNHLGYMWAEAGENLERAHEMIRRAVAAEPDNPAYLDSLGWVLFKLKRPAEALPHLEKAAQLMEKEPDATVLDHLGDVLAALGKQSEAEARWREALKLEGADPGIGSKLKATPP